MYHILVTNSKNGWHSIEQYLNLSGNCLWTGIEMETFAGHSTFYQASCLWTVRHIVRPENFMEVSQLPHYLHHKVHTLGEAMLCVIPWQWIRYSTSQQSWQICRQGKQIHSQNMELFPLRKMCCHLHKPAFRWMDGHPGKSCHIVGSQLAPAVGRLGAQYWL